MPYDELSRKQLEEVLQEMEQELKETQNEKDELEKKAKKVKADFENYKKKQDDRKEKWQRRAEEKLAEDMIQIMDNLERAILSAENKDSTIVKGVKMVGDQLYEELQKRGLQRIDAEGEEFDPNLHKAVETKEHDEHKKVLEQKRKGYMFDQKVLREAEVVVSEKKEE